MILAASKHLFKRSVRAYSHGCMRVRNPRRFAEVLLSKNGNWSQQRIDQVIAGGKNHPVTLETKVPIHITYFTVWVTEDGRLRFANDIYGHDARIKSAIGL